LSGKAKVGNFWPKKSKKIVTAMEACKQASFRINMNYDFTITIPAFFPELTPSQGRG
jgi:hypothetical protein